MPTVATTKYFKIFMTEELEDGRMRYSAREVKDATGERLDRHSEIEVMERPAGAPELARGTIVKVERSVTTTFTINPAS